MSEEQIALRQMLERREREFLLGNGRVKVRSSVENLDVGDFHIEHLAEGETIDLPPIRHHYSESLTSINPTGIVPIGPASAL